jgi:PAS domain S-box-containing protein
LTGQTAADAQRLGWLNVLHPDDRARVQTAWQHAMDTHTTYEVEYRVQPRTGDYRHIAVRGVPVFDDEGRFREWVGTLTDVTESRLIERNEAFLDLLQHQLRRLSDPDDIEDMTIQRLGEYLNADRCHFASIDVENDEAVVVREWRREAPAAMLNDHIFAATPTTPAVQHMKRTRPLSFRQRSFDQRTLSVAS